MVQIKEFRIIMPMSLAEYEVAQMYMVLKMQQENTTNTEGVDVLENRPFEDNLIGKGHYTSKVYSFQSKIPSWLTTFAPADSLLLKEEAWNAYPKCKSVIKCSSLSKLLLTIDTIHVADNGKSENVHGLNKDQLALRQVEIIDIASSVRDYWSYLVGSCNVDLSKFKSTRTNRGPLVEGWRDRCNPVMTAYKLVTVDAPYWGFGKRLEQVLMAGERALFLETHSNIFAWIDEWHGMSIEKLRELEEQLYSSSNEGSMIPVPLKTMDALDRKCSLECKDANSQLKPEDQNFALAMSD
ncbi:phosphatidylinositol transfer protein 1-like [Chenopodium quinoa]|uniref:phosphatidylinositol transfer protein 1-like n=1 Tax=Chenopodium quinoa TaxID=63459 RepID=UPI000B78DC4E|nr:phosphatidylinositol transfer protein 1-like [Chenopodium quinoa]